jgi:methionine--tRNA ligase beta chain
MEETQNIAKTLINYDEFSRVELKVVKVISAERVDGSEKLLKLQVDMGTEQRQIVSGIAKAYEPEKLVGKEIVIVVNLEPRKLMGLESQGMLLAASDEQGPVILMPDREVPPGSGIK